MRLIEDALSICIMEYLYEVKEIHRKNLSIPFSNYNYKYYARIVKRLIDEGYIEVFKKNRVNYVRLTSEGLAEYLHKQKMANGKIPKKNSKRQYTKGAKRRESLVINALGLCEGCGIITAEDEKPPLEELVKNRGAESEYYENEFESCLESGVFYSSKEIRQAYIKVNGRNEIANWTRLVGVVFIKHRMTFIYSIGDTLIKWRSGSEDRTVTFIKDFLIGSDCIKRHIENTKYASCIICGKGISMIPKIVMGRRWGKIEESKDTERYRAVIAKDHINSHNLSKVFSSAYYVPMNKNGVNSFLIACMIGEAEKETACNKWFDSVAGVTRIESLPYHQGVSGKGERIVYMPYIDLIELEFYKKQGDPCHFVIPKGTQEAVSRVMGPLLLSAQGLKGTKLKYRRYDDKGSPIDGSIWRTETKGEEKP